MSKTLIAYVTRTGHARALAGILSTKLGANVHEIIDLVKRRGWLGYLKTGAQASQGKATPISEAFVDLKELDTLIIVQPVWAGSVTPPVRSWLIKHKPEILGKKLGVLATNLGSPAQPIKAKFEAEFGKLDAFTVVRQTATEKEREEQVMDFLRQLGLSTS